MQAAAPPLRTTNRNDALLGKWITVAKAFARAQSQGQPSNEIANFTAEAQGLGFSREDIQGVQLKVPSSPSDRLLRLGRDYERIYPNEANWRAKNLSWASEEEIATVAQRMKAAMESQQMPTPVQVPARPPLMVVPPASPFPDIAPPEEIQLDAFPQNFDATGKRIHELLERLFKAAFVFKGRHSGNGRITEYRFAQDLKARDDKGQLQPIVSIELIQSKLPSAIKLYGELEQGRSPIVISNYGYFAVQIPRRNWCRETDSIPIEEVVPFATTRFAAPSDALQLPVGKTLAGLPLFWEPSRRGFDHASVVGSTGGGKNSIIDTVCYGGMRRYPTSLLQFIMCDPQGLNLSHFAGMPWIWQKEGQIQKTAEEIEEAIAATIEEMESREQLFTVRNVRNISEFNTKFPEESRFRLIFVFDELKLARDRSNDPKAFDKALADIAAGGGKLGIHLLVCSQRNAAGYDDAFSPNLRENINVRFAVKTASESLSEKAFSMKFGDAFYLGGEGDAFAYMPGMDTPERVQVYWTDSTVIEAYRKALKTERMAAFVSRRRPVRESIGGTNPFDQLLLNEALSEIAPPLEATRPQLSLVSQQKDAEFEEVKQAIALLKAEGGDITARRLLENLYGGKGAADGRNLEKNRDRLATVLARNGYEAADYKEAIAKVVADC